MLKKYITKFLQCIPGTSQFEDDLQTRAVRVCEDITEDGLKYNFFEESIRDKVSGRVYRAIKFSALCSIKRKKYLQFFLALSLISSISISFLYIKYSFPIIFPFHKYDFFDLTLSLTCSLLTTIILVITISRLPSESFGLLKYLTITITLLFLSLYIVMVSPHYAIPASYVILSNIIFSSLLFLTILAIEGGFLFICRFKPNSYYSKSDLEDLTVANFFYLHNRLLKNTSTFDMNEEKSSNLALLDEIYVYTRFLFISYSQSQDPYIRSWFSAYSEGWSTAIKEVKKKFLSPKEDSHAELLAWSRKQFVSFSTGCWDNLENISIEKDINTRSRFLILFRVIFISFLPFFIFIVSRLFIPEISISEPVYLAFIIWSVVNLIAHLDPEINNRLDLFRKFLEIRSSIGRNG